MRTYSIRSRQLFSQYSHVLTVFGPGVGVKLCPGVCVKVCVVLRSCRGCEILRLHTAEPHRDGPRLLRMLRGCVRVVGGMRAAAQALASAPSAALATSPVRLLARHMSLWKSDAVKGWVGDQAIANPTQWRPFKFDGRWRPPELSRRFQALRIKEAIRNGEIQLEPTLMVPPPKFRGHRRERLRPAALESIATKMEAMPKLVAEYRQAARERRQKMRADARWK